MPTKLSDEQRAEIVQMYIDGTEKIEYIAAIFGVRREYVSHLAIRRGVPMRRPQSSRYHKEMKNEEANRRGPRAVKEQEARLRVHEEGVRNNAPRRGNETQHAEEENHPG